MNDPSQNEQLVQLKIYVPASFRDRLKADAETRGASMGKLVTAAYESAVRRDVPDDVQQQHDEGISGT